MRHTSWVVRLTLLSFLLAISCWASITGSISGLVTDPSGAVVSGATVIATNTQTGVQTTLKSDAKGFYSFPALQIGTYTVEVQQPGFKTQKQTGLVIDANSALRADFPLQVGEVQQQVTIASDAVYVETESTQNGEVITAKKISSTPLNGRFFTDLLALQPGVSPYSSVAPGLNDRPASGSTNSIGGTNAGNQAVNGQRESANGFMVNGSNVEEGKNNGAAIIPNLDSIEEFRIITNNFDSEYGNYSGGQVNVATKSGTNSFHGTAFDFLRNTALDATRFFDLSPAVYIQNQFGGTVGGPVRRNKTFFFADYQGTRQIQGQPANIQVPSLPDRTGDLSDQNGSLTGSISGPGFATLLNQRMGLPPGTLFSDEPYFFSGCANQSQCVFPAAVIPQAAWSPASNNLLKFIPTRTPGAPTNFFVSNAEKLRLRDDKGGIRVDENTHDLGTIFFYYFLDDYFAKTPYPNGGATVPGFSAGNLGRAQLVNIGDTKSFGSSSVNEFRFSYVRNSAQLGNPTGGLGSGILASLGFVSGFNATTGGIAPIDPTIEGVPTVGFNNFTIGVPSDTVHQFNNSFQWLDNFSKVAGTHTFKFGGQFHYDQINERNFFGENGDFSFAGGETGLDFADFLIGAPDSFIQASKQILDSRTKYMGLYFQDSWRARPNLTLNYGLRWEFSQPWYDTTGKIETIVPGEQSVLFPTAPKGWVVPGDPGIPKTLAPTKYDAFSPRLGLLTRPAPVAASWASCWADPGRAVFAPVLGFTLPRLRI